MNIYSDDRFSAALGAAYYPHQVLNSTQFYLGDRVWKLPARQGQKNIVLDPFASAFIDFYEPDESDGFEVEALPNVGYLPKVSHGMVTVAQWFEENLEQSYQAAPTILWNTFSSWEMFVKHVQQRRSNVFSDSRRRRRKLEKEVGELTFVFDDRRAETRETCMRWKSAQYQRSRCTDHFASAEHIRFFEELAERDLLRVSSLSAGDQLLAVHLGAFADDRLYWWVPAYDETYAAYSPGRLMLELILEASFQQGHREFDFLIGDESYKWYYATHTRLIGDLGEPPLSLRLNWAAEAAKETGKSIVKHGLKPFPGLLNSLKSMRR